MKNGLFVGMFALVAGFLVLGCDTGTNGEMDTWSQVTSVDDLDGNWEGSGTISIPKNETTGIPNTSVGFDVSMSYTKGAPSISMTTKIDFDVFLDDMIKARGFPPTEIIKIITWSEIIKNFPEGYEIGNYYLAGEEESLVAEFTPSEELKINKKHTKLKLTIPKDIVSDLGMNKDIEIILDKK
ncbi:hypothetical protein FACS189445_3700 [Spirochaetia bacterium]|nr:hypothetical protein FACS189445_3700 [Spirochaetia bacterium]